MGLKVTDTPYWAKQSRFVRAVCLPEQMFPAGEEYEKEYFFFLPQYPFRTKQISYDNGITVSWTA